MKVSIYEQRVLAQIVGVDADGKVGLIPSVSFVQANAIASLPLATLDSFLGVDGSGNLRLMSTTAFLQAGDLAGFQTRTLASILGVDGAGRPGLTAASAFLQASSFASLPSRSLTSVAGVDGSGNLGLLSTAGFLQANTTTAVGDGVTDDTAAIQTAINAAYAAGGGVVYLPPGKTYSVIGLAMKTGVTLASRLGQFSGAATGATLLAHGTGTIISTVGASNFAIDGLKFKGLGAGTAVQGVVFDSGSWWSALRRCNFDNFSDEAFILDGVANTVEDVLVINSLMNRSRLARSGASTIRGTDHYINRLESTASTGVSITSSSLFCVGVLFDSASNCMGVDIIGETSDVGIVFQGSSLLNKMVNCRGDHNAAYGWQIGAAQSTFSSCGANDNACNGNNTYAGFYTTGPGNCFSACRSEKGPGVNNQQYAFQDTAQNSVTGALNTYVGCSGSAVTAVFAPGLFAGSGIEQPPHPQTSQNGATPDITGTSYLAHTPSAATTITNFLGGSNGQTLFVECATGLTSIANNGNIATFNGSTITPNAGQIVVFKNRQGLWHQVSDVDLTSGYMRYSTVAAATAATIPWSVQYIHVSGYYAVGDGGGATYQRVSVQPSHNASLRSADRWVPNSSVSDNTNGGWWANIEKNLTFEMLGAKGDGTTNDAPAINNCGAAAVALGLTTVHASPGKTYRLTTAINPRQNLVWEGHGAKFISSVGYPTMNGIFCNGDYVSLTLIGSLTADLTGPTDQLALNSVAGLAVGDRVAVRLGNNPFDNNEPRYAFTATVLAIVGTTVTLDWVIPHSINITTSYTYVYEDGTGSVAGVPAATASNKCVYKISGEARNLTFRDMELRGDGTTSVECGASFQWGSNIRLENVTGNMDGTTTEMGAGLICGQFLRHVRIINPVLNINKNTRAQASCGRFMGFSNCIDVIVDNAVARRIHNSAIFCESFCEDIVFRNFHNDVRYGDVITSTFYYVATSVQGSRLRMESPVVETNCATGTAIFADVGGSDGKVLITGYAVWRGPIPSTYSYPPDILAVFEYENPATGDKCVIDYAHPITASLYIPLQASGSINYYLPRGPMIDGICVASSTVDLTLLSSVYVGYTGNNWIDQKAYFNPGKAQWLRGFGISSDGGFAKLTSRTKVLVNTPIGAQPAGAFIGIQARIAPVLYSSSGDSFTRTANTLDDASMKAMLTGSVS